MKTRIHHVIKTCTYQLCKRQSADTNVVIGRYRLLSKRPIIGRYRLLADCRYISSQSTEGIYALSTTKINYALASSFFHPLPSFLLSVKSPAVDFVRLSKKCHDSDEVGSMCTYIHERLTEILPPKTIQKLTATSDSSSGETRLVFLEVLSLRGSTV